MTVEELLAEVIGANGYDSAFAQHGMLVSSSKIIFGGKSSSMGFAMKGDKTVPKGCLAFLALAFFRPTLTVAGRRLRLPTLPASRPSVGRCSLPRPCCPVAGCC